MEPELLGFTCVIPLSEKAFKRYKKGTLSEWEIGDLPEDIEEKTDANNRYLLIQSIEFLQDY
jgi:hypothetical protein